MNKIYSKKIALIISNQEIKEMFDLAKNNIEDWSKVSIVNKGMTKGTAWNILASDFDVTHSYSNIAKVNMIREFGEFLPINLKENKKSTEIIKKTIVHQIPKFK